MTPHNLGHVALYQGDHIQAGALFAEALSVSHEIGNAQCIAECLTGLVGVLVAKKIVLDAARLFGAALEPADRAERDRSLSAARNDSVEEAAFVAVWVEGCAMTLEQAVEFALENVIDA